MSTAIALAILPVYLWLVSKAAQFILSKITNPNIKAVLLIDVNPEGIKPKAKRP